MSRSMKALVILGAVALASGCTPRKSPKGKNALVDDGSGVVTAGGKSCKVAEMIEDGENNDNQVIVAGGRNGYLYTFVDQAGSTVTPQAGDQGGTFTMTGGGANGSGFAAHMTGTTATAPTVFVGVGFNFLDPKTQYDASKFDGLGFFARRGPEGAKRVRLKLPDAGTDPDGGTCEECFNDFGFDINLKEEWTQYFIPFSAMKQMSGWGKPHPAAVQPSKVYAVQFQVGDKGTTFDMWFDELSFIKCD